MNKLIKIQADIINGIYFVNEFDENFDELTQESILLDTIAISQETVYAEISENMADMLNNSYGIKNYNGGL